jgi:hypothetical protein
MTDDFRHTLQANGGQCINTSHGHLFKISFITSQLPTELRDLQLNKKLEINQESLDIPTLMHSEEFQN